LIIKDTGLNGLVQSLSATGRAACPFLSGSLFTVAAKVKTKVEALAVGVFGGVAFLGFLLSSGTQSPDLEAEGWGEDDDLDRSEDED
jgi:hypothetical protein